MCNISYGFENCVRIAYIFIKCNIYRLKYKYILTSESLNYGLNLLISNYEIDSRDSMFVFQIRFCYAKSG